MPGSPAHSPTTFRPAGSSRQPAWWAARPSFIIFRHILPHLAGPLLGQATLRFGQFLINVGALSYLGLGVQPPQSDWGSMLATAQPYAARAPLTILVPGLVIFVVALCVTLIGQHVSRMTGSRLLLSAAPATGGGGCLRDWSSKS